MVNYRDYFPFLLGLWWIVYIMFMDCLYISLPACRQQWMMKEQHCRVQAHDLIGKKKIAKIGRGIRMRKALLTILVLLFPITGISIANAATQTTSTQAKQDQQPKKIVPIAPGKAAIPGAPLEKPGEYGITREGRATVQPKYKQKQKPATLEVQQPKQQTQSQ